VADAIRYFFDQHISSAVAQGLRHRGIEILTAHEAHRCGFDDAEQLQFAEANEYVIVTFDRDYLALDAGGVSHAGIAWCPATKYSVGQLIQALMLLHGVLTTSEMRDHVEYL
jgi:predicted nuclease of predicted toxin-antitoxin system